MSLTWLSRLPYPLRNVLARWRGLIGMFVGVGIALGVGMAMLAVSNAGVDLFTADFLVSDADLYLVTEGGNPIPILPGDTPGTIESAGFTLASIRVLPAVRSAVGMLTWPLEREHPRARLRDRPTELFLVAGVDGDPTRIPDMLDLKAGRWLRRADEVVLGPTLAREKVLGIGNTLRLNGRDFTVVGIGKLRGFGFGMDAVAYMDARSLHQRVAVGDVVQMIAVDADDVAQARGLIESMGSLAVFDAGQLVARAEEANESAILIRWVFSGLTLAIAALFVSNMLSRSVATRRMEFATLRAIGIPSRTILATVALEALLISAVSALIGIALSSAIGELINRQLAPLYGLDRLYSADAGLFATIVALALGLGLVAGLMPARQATRVDPVDVLREA